MSTRERSRRPGRNGGLDPSVRDDLPEAPPATTAGSAPSGAVPPARRAPAPADLPLRVRWRRRLRLGSSSTERRLLAHLTETGEAVERRIADLPPCDGQLPSWALSARRLLDRAEAALGRSDLETGYACLLAAQRAEIVGLSSHELKAAASALRQEASSEKFGGWRGKAIVALLEDAGGDDPADDPAHDDERRARDEEHKARLVEARAIRDESLQNGYRKIERLRQQLLLLGLSLACAVAGIITVASLVEVPETTGFTMTPSVLGLVALFGALGGSLTAILSVIRGGTASSIPQQLIQGSVVVIRPFFGAAAALAVYTFLGSGLVTVASNSAAAIFAVSFVAGFSEQLITSSVGKLVPKNDGPAPR